MPRSCGDDPEDTATIDDLADAGMKMDDDILSCEPEVMNGVYPRMPAMKRCIRW